MGLETVIGRLLDTASVQNDQTHGVLSAGTRTLAVGKRRASDDWRVNVRKLAMLARLQRGWDCPDSEPLDRDAEANYLDWLPTVPADRMDDAEPMLTDEGHIRLEWRRDGYVRIAEIGARSLYLAVLAPNRADDDAEEFEEYNPEALDQFFLRGAIR